MRPSKKHEHVFGWLPQNGQLHGTCRCKLRVALDIEQVRELLPATAPSRKKLPDERSGVTQKLTIQTPDGELDHYLTINSYEDGTPAEMFVRVSKQGTTISGLADALAIAVSIGLQHGIPLSLYVNKFQHTAFEPSGPTGDATQPFALSPLDLLFGWLARRFPASKP